MTQEVTLKQARQVVPKPAGLRITRKQYGVTADIISSVRQVFSKNYGQTVQLANLLKGTDQLESAWNVFRFVRKNIVYVLDPLNKQLIRTPADIVHNRTADCKGLAILINSLLANLGIRSAFRFVSFSAFPTVTHVYALAFIDGKTYVLDACLPEFNQEKPYNFKEDYMTEIIEISGFGMKAQMARARMHNRPHTPGSFRRFKTNPHPQAVLLPGETPLNISGFESEGLLDLKLQRQSLEIDRHHAAIIHGIGSDHVGELNENIAAINSAIAAFEDENFIAVAGIGAAIGKKKKGGILKKVASGVKKGVKKATKATKKVIKKAATVAKKVAKTTLKVVTAPARLLVKGIAEVALPKMAPFFLYLFITNPTTISKLPSKVQRKRKKAEKFARFMTRTIGMKEAHFMKIVSNGIKRKYGKTPEQLLSERLKGQPISGIGLLPLVALIPVIVEVIGKITSIFGKKPSADETPTEEDVPDLENDFAEMLPQETRKLVAHLKHKPASQTYQEPADPEDSLQQRQEESVTRQIESEDPETPVDAPLPMPEPETAEEAAANEEGENGNFREAAPEPEPGPASNSTGSSMLPLLAGAAAVVLITRKKRK